MLVELAVEDLGVIASTRIPLGPGLVALTGETGAGKTMLVDALHLLSGARGDASKVRGTAAEATVQGLFAIDGPDDGAEWSLVRTVPAQGRSRARINGQLATAGELAELGDRLLEINGQHAQQRLLSTRTQREALDRFGGIDRGPFDTARRALAELIAALEELGGDERSRAREMDLCRFQVAEIDDVAPVDGEDDQLSDEEDLLSAALERRRSGEKAVALLADDGAAGDLLARAADLLGDAPVFAEQSSRLVDLAAEVSDCVAELRRTTEGIEPDDERLAEVRSRRHRLVELRRKYGDTIADVLAFRDETAKRLAELAGHEERRAELVADIAALEESLALEAAALGAARRAAAGGLAEAIEAHLAELAMAGARVEVSTEDGDGVPGAAEHVELRIAANAGSSPGPLSKVASGGELSRVMLALRLVLSEGPPTMVFDEVDAGIGGETAVAVGRELARLGRERQVLVVTHLAQVAAFADQQIRIEKQTVDGVTATTATVLDDSERVVELARMLSGSPDSEAALRHARELLELSAQQRPAR